MRLNVLVIDRAPPANASQGNELIARSLFPILRTDHHVTLLAPVISGEEAAARAAVADFFDRVELVPRASRVTSLGGWVEAELGRTPLPLRGPVDLPAVARFRDAIRHIVSVERIDIAHVRQLPMAPYGRDLGRTPRLLELVDSEGLASSRDTAITARGRVRRRVAPWIERVAVRGYPVTTAVAEADAAWIREAVPGARVVVVPNGVDAERFRPRPDALVSPGSIVLVGAMSFPPNVAAARWFAGEVLPLIRRVRPDATFTIVGRDPAAAVRALADNSAVIVTGGVPDVRPYLAQAAVVVAPMVSGSGIKNKILEAMAMGRPVVATSLGTEGLAAEAGRELVVVDGAAAFADAVASLLGDPDRAASLGAAGRSLVEARYTWRACAAAYAGLYAELVQRRGVDR